MCVRHSWTHCKAVLFRQKVGQWCFMFDEEKQNVEHERRNERSSTSTNENNIARVQDMSEDRHITVSK
ncbi:hypothetical protein TNCV_499661 [Trichonephila clavipes]|nr:hypothetical protein TNCV_499661 [Trichonephila clavipes]